MGLTITLPAEESWDPVKEEFVNYPESTVTFNHCLYAIAKWEEIWKKPFLRCSKREPELTIEELNSYIECMVEGPVPANLVNRLTNEHQKQLAEYIGDNKSATIITRRNKMSNSERLTSEVLYFYLSAYQMPFDICDKWHISRLLTLLEVASIKNTPEKKMSSRAILSQNAALNKIRRAGRPG